MLENSKSRCRKREVAGVNNWKKLIELRLLQASSVADVTYIEMLELAQNIDIGYDLKELERDNGRCLQRNSD